MWNLVVFAVIGLLAGGAARMFFAGRQLANILGTLALGVIGALAGGMISWIFWPWVEGDFHFGSLLLSMLGAMIAIAVRSGWAYSRDLSVAREATP